MDLKGLCISFAHSFWNVSSPLSMSLLAFTNCSLSYYSVVIGVLLMCLVFFIVIHPVFISVILYVIVASIIMFNDSARGQGSTIFILDNYCRPCRYNKVFLECIIVLNCSVLTHF